MLLANLLSQFSTVCSCGLNYRTSGCTLWLIPHFFKSFMLILQINVLGINGEMFVVGRLIGKLFYHRLWRNSKNLYSHGYILGSQWTQHGSHCLMSHRHSVPPVLLSVPCALKIGVPTAESPSNTYRKFHFCSHQDDSRNVRAPLILPSIIPILWRLILNGMEKSWQKFFTT